MASNMLTCRLVRLFGATYFRQNINGELFSHSNLRGKSSGAVSFRHAPFQSQHGSGRGIRRGRPNRIKDNVSQGVKRSNASPAVISGSREKDGISHSKEHEFDNQYFSSILDHQITEEDVREVQSHDSVSMPSAREHANEFDSQYFQGLQHKEVKQQLKLKPRNVKIQTTTKPGRTIRGHFMFGDIDSSYFDDISSSFVYENNEKISTVEPSEFDINEFDQQYFGRESTLSAEPLPVSTEPKYIDTSLSEDEMYRQLLSNRRPVQEEDGEESKKDLKSRSFEAHDRPSRYQDLSEGDYADHREVHLITESSVDEVLLESLPPDVRGKLIAERQWEEQKDELRVSRHNLDDLEDSVVSALKAVKKKRKKTPKPMKTKEMMKIGTEDSMIPVSKIPCSGCGAFLQCQDNSNPGFIPSEKFKDLDVSKPFSNMVCQRCWYIIHRETALNVSVPQDSYSDIIKAVRKNQTALVILMVDLLDFPCSIIKNLKDMIGSKRPVVIVGNKLDVLPKDEPKQEARIKEQLVCTCVEMGVCDEDKLVDVQLISAKSGYGVESLISKILSRPKKSDVYLLGTANVGKSTLFNRFLSSDLCKAKASSLVGRATISQWPGTTLNLLGFPLLIANRQRMAMRTIRLKNKEKEAKMERKEKEADRLKRKLETQEGPQIMSSYVEGDVGQTFKPKRVEEEEPALQEDGDPFGLSLHNLDSNKVDGRKRTEKAAPFNPEEYKESQWFYDTPGVIYDQQVLTSLTSAELKLVVPKRCIIPRSLIMKPGQTFFLAGLGRLDYLEGRDSIYFTVFSSNALPIKVVDTQDAEATYAEKAGYKTWVIPIGGEERMQSFPAMLPTEFTLQGIGRHKSVADILFSSAGWAAVTANKGMDVHLRAFTPGGLGCVLRTPALLPFGFGLRGTRRSKASPFYNVNKQKLLMYMR